jgi:RND superfamily putative drug exporter
MADNGWVSSGVATLSRPVRERLQKVAAGEGAYSDRLARLAGFSSRHKALVIGVWVVTAGALAVLFPQLETVVRQQSVNLIPRDAPSIQRVGRMGAACSAR